MTPQHHLPEALLVEYVAGHTTEPVALAVACHITLCGPCQARAAELEQIAGAVLEAAPSAALAPDALTRALARLDEPAPPPRPLAPLPASPAGEPPIPAPLRRYLGGAPALPWRFFLPGLRVIALPIGAPGTKTRLVRFAPGTAVPKHDHEGAEYIVVFSGQLDEEGARFGRGDIAIHSPGESHDQRVAEGETCVALVVNLGPLVPLTWKGKLLKGLLGVT